MAEPPLSRAEMRRLIQDAVRENIRAVLREEQPAPPPPDPPRPFHTISIDYIMGLPTSPPPEGYNIVLSVTDKFSKAVTFIPGKKTMTGEDWALSLMDRLLLLNWGLPRAIISDRDRKFVAGLWRGLFKQLKVDLMYSTAYHPQTDGSSESTNQTAEIALRYWLMTLKDISAWPMVLQRLQAALNNSVKQSTKLSPNEILFGFRTGEPLDLVRINEPDTVEVTLSNQADTLMKGSPSRLRTDVHTGTKEHQPKKIQLVAIDQYRPAHIDAKDAVAFASTAMKHYPDKKHTPRYFAVGDMVNLRLHRGYTLPSLVGQNRKLGQQFGGPLRVTERVGQLAYRLDIPTTWRIHDVISVAHLEPASTNDPYRRPRPEHPDAVITSSDTAPEWEIERLLRKRTYRKGRGYTTEYLARWLGYGPEYDS